VPSSLRIGWSATGRGSMIDSACARAPTGATASSAARAARSNTGVVLRVRTARRKRVAHCVRTVRRAAGRSSRDAAHR
jgi:hypothetical protein